MISFRSFCNTDPPAIAAIWRSRAEQLGLSRAASPDVFEQLVFSKPFFERAGLILAFEEGRPVGFAHAGFGANENNSGISTALGTTCLMMLEPGCSESDVAAGLLEHCEEYLRGRGAQVLYGGGMAPLNPFYLGLYGGSELPGVLDSDQIARTAFENGRYREIERTRIMRIDLNRFESVIDRQQMQIRRQMVVEAQIDAPTRTWWEACTLGEFELTRFEMVPRGGGSAVASALFRGMDPSGAKTFGRTAGLMTCAVDPAYRRRGYAVFLLSEAFRQFQRQGIMTVEAQTLETNLPAVNLYKKMKFEQIGGGGIFRKEG
ncbi:MAG: GNAT family N-acetyltransferase [Pirellulales bacterium]|nr:GNAT family N-acetyltransferase [Pirellulales bacterium]